MGTVAKVIAWKGTFTKVAAKKVAAENGTVTEAPAEKDAVGTNESPAEKVAAVVTVADAEVVTVADKDATPAEKVAADTESHCFELLDEISLVFGAGARVILVVQS